MFLSVPPAVARREHRETRDTTPGRCRCSATSSCRRCTSALAADARPEERDSTHWGPLTQGPRSAGEGADAVVRGDDMEALRLPLVGEVRGPEGPITWLPTLNRGREGLQRQGLMRVVTDTPVTTRAVAKATLESEGEALSGACLTALASRFAVDRGVVHARCDGPPQGSMASAVASLRAVGRADVRWRRGNSLAPDLCAIGVLKGRPTALTTGRASSSNHAARAHGTAFTPPSCLGVCFSNARIERDARVSQPGDPRGA